MAKPATQRPKLPSVGRLGLVEPSAPSDLDRLGWNTDPHIELLWSLSRAPDADVALRTMVRLADSTKDWDKLNQELVTDKALRGRLFGVVGSSLALGDHLVANPGSWHLLAGEVRLPSVDELRTMFTESIGGASDVRPALQTLYRDRLLVLAALDLASVVENEPVLPFVKIGEHLSDLADAALGAALLVATRSVCGDDGQPPRLVVIAMGK
jgi:glutamate-ammonia-ligase adenylyltransferase